MNSAFRFFSQTIAFFLTLVFIASANADPCSYSFSKKAGISANATPFSSSLPSDDQNSDSSSTSTEELDDDIVLLDQKNVEPFAYSIFIPVEALPLVSHSIPPLQRPPRI